MLKKLPLSVLAILKLGTWRSNQDMVFFFKSGAYYDVSYSALDPTSPYYPQNPDQTQFDPADFPFKDTSRHWVFPEFAYQSETAIPTFNLVPPTMPIYDQGPVIGATSIGSPFVSNPEILVKCEIYFRPTKGKVFGAWCLCLVVCKLTLSYTSLSIVVVLLVLGPKASILTPNRLTWCIML